MRTSRSSGCSATIDQLSNTIRRGDFGFPTAPLVLGNEGAGIVEESDRFARGTRVAVCGHSDLGVSVDGPFQQCALVRDDRLLQLPDGLDWAEGAALTVNYLTAYLGPHQGCEGAQRADRPGVRGHRLTGPCGDADGPRAWSTAHRTGLVRAQGALGSRGRSMGGAVVERA
ncbi:alcohol dehydrogenase catalytic domain-containing protein [Streptomyces mirabilis]|uniref:alcohol dehydrogenase catalytic domain-containing protein n=1 Tax=Streptomyces mirabilis TaxID=68239 RepID=UPI00352E7D70